MSLPTDRIPPAAPSMKSAESVYLELLMGERLCASVMPFVVYQWLGVHPEVNDPHVLATIGALMPEWHGTGHELIEAAHLL
jgi:hypothetical protein